MRSFLRAAIVFAALIWLAAAVSASQDGQENPFTAAAEPPPVRPLYAGLERSLQLPDAPSDHHEAQASAPSDLPAWAKLVYQSARNENDWEIYIADADGTNATNISRHHKMDIHPRLNRGATRVVFASDRTGDDFEIYTMAADGSALARLTDNESDDGAPAWSPDGTRIVFQAYRDGQPEIYVMAANGSGQTRLTNNPDFDGMPVWSPDGSRIAFVSRRNSQYRIWVMAADGSNQRPLSSQPYSANPAWSPNGDQIAFDADGNGDGWQELWLMNADGSQQRQVYDPPQANTDAWARSWSPDGKAILFTRVSYTYYRGNWYWTTATMNYWTSDLPWFLYGIVGSNADWHPTLETTDIQAPASAVKALPPQSPGPFIVSWSGNDLGSSGIMNFDIQVKEGNSAWANWQTATKETSLAYPGIGGRTYAFRARARDNAGNVEAWPVVPDAVTTVEAQPPVSSIQRLPAFTRPNPVLRWSGVDPGGSGIDSYFVEFRQGTTGAWQPLLSGTSEEYAFDGLPGYQYFFRVRAIDNAQNIEPWPPGESDTFTTIYNWAASGQAHDNRGTPLADVAITTTPEAFAGSASDLTGRYAAYVATAAESYTARWEKPGYAELPPTSFGAAQDAQMQVAMPPSNNVVINGGFESGSLTPAWQGGGDFPARIASAARHTGAHGVVLGCQAPAPQQVSNTTTFTFVPQLAVDRDGVIHVVWQESIGADKRDILYARRGLDGVWSRPLNVSNSSDSSIEPRVALDSTGTLHVTWHEYVWTNTGWEGRRFYTQVTTNGIWTPPAVVAISKNHYPADVQLATDRRDRLHVIWAEVPGVYYLQRSSDGVWSPVMRVDAGERWSYEPSMAVEASGAVHVAWKQGDEIVYAFKPADGNWTPPRIVVADNLVSKPKLAVDEGGTAHLIWQKETQAIYYARRSPAGAWSSPQLIFNRPGFITALSFVAGADGVLHLLAEFSDDMDISLFYLWQNRAGLWSEPQQISRVESRIMPSAKLAADNNGVVHLVSKSTDGTKVIYRRRQTNGLWDGPQTLAAVSGAIDDLDVVADGAGRPHVVWIAGNQVFYGTPSISDRAGDSFIAQTIAIPATASHPTLSFFYRLDNQAAQSGSRLEVQLQANGSRASLFSSGDRVPSWSHRWFDLTPWAGQNATLTWRVEQDAQQACVNVFLDEITVGSAYADVWVSSPARTARPGQTLTYPIYYGNRSGVPAAGVVITLTLPAGLTFVSADPPPVVTAPALRWEVGDLPAQSGRATIMVTATVDATAPPGASFASAVEIAAAPEIERANNNAETRVLVGGVLYLPLLLR